mmetsp:Transcript_10663/g.30210  ORF Transcript_10663/g.30210 Transcript_10663/m.30210 type:complete len:294 (+) Transcript_10663:508-1389(+)
MSVRAGQLARTTSQVWQLRSLCQSSQPPAIAFQPAQGWLVARLCETRSTVARLRPCRRGRTHVRKSGPEEQVCTMLSHFRWGRAATVAAPRFSRGAQAPSRRLPRPSERRGNSPGPHTCRGIRGREIEAPDGTPRLTCCSRTPVRGAAPFSWRAGRPSRLGTLPAFWCHRRRSWRRISLGRSLRWPRWPRWPRGPLLLSPPPSSPPSRPPSSPSPRPQQRHWRPPFRRQGRRPQWSSFPWHKVGPPRMRLPPKCARRTLDAQCLPLRRAQACDLYPGSSLSSTANPATNLMQT